ncbi:hypothetical protein TK90_2805 (plasmid) [Thioalkalivibrio sp. K90mix]|uniref:hypothetical protein n=1 Tax=Thioalkalivibrio sp. (strain K90mix) TaxID=396595 RepID=UPI000195A723|nr:hypothetical protein [Thioalkalivibrio sp. K90mix]ADC73290.1 hypothetical protein TK90_2805 [Thioalkalivibrio sp. K90mix]
MPEILKPLQAIRRRLQKAARSADRLVRDPRFKDLYHAPEKNEDLHLDLVLMGTRAMVVSPAKVINKGRWVVPAWTPSLQSDFATLDGVQEVWLVLHRSDTESESEWFALRPDKDIYFVFEEDRDSAYIYQMVGDPEPADQSRSEATGETFQLNMRHFLENAEVEHLVAFAQSQWGRRGLYPETREILREMYGEQARSIWDIDDAQGESVTLESNPEQILLWLGRHRPFAFAVTILVPYVNEHHPLGINVEMDQWLRMAIEIVDPELDVQKRQNDRVDAVVRELLKKIPDEKIDPKGIEGEGSDVISLAERRQRDAQAKKDSVSGE